MNPIQSMQNPHPTIETRSRLDGLGFRALALTCVALVTPAPSRAGQTAGLFAGEVSGETVKLDDLTVTAERVESKNYKVPAEALVITLVETPKTDKAKGGVMFADMPAR